VTLFIKGNLDVKDTLHSLTVDGTVVWNGINAILRKTHPGTVARLRHETWTRSDALLEATGIVPADLSDRDLPFGAYPLATQFSDALFKTDADAIILSLQPDITNLLVRHRRRSYLLYPGQREEWSAADQSWARRDFTGPELLDVETSMHNFAAIVARIRLRCDAPILVYNLSSVIPGDLVHCHEGLGEIFSTRIKRFNLGVAELSQRTGISVIDVDRIVACGGADHLKLDAVHLSGPGCRQVAAEVVRVLDDLGVLPPAGSAS
jgi:hypothetical protein